ncbi:MAG: hypothetical protein ABI411_03475 [Tahibacter sp.]
MIAYIQNNNAIRSTPNEWPPFEALLKVWLCLGCITLLLAPGARGYSAQFGYIAYWLVAAPLLLIFATHAREWRARPPVRNLAPTVRARGGLMRLWTRSNRRCHQTGRSLGARMNRQA